MRIGVPNEGTERRLVASTPKSVGNLIKLGYEVTVESGAGECSHYPDYQFEDAGAHIGDAPSAWGADIVLSVGTPTTEQLDLMKEGATLIAQLAPARNEDLADSLAERKITALAMDTVPRISRAQ